MNCSGNATKTEPCHNEPCTNCFAVDTDYWASEAMTVDRLSGVGSPEACYQLCLEEPQCVYFTYVVGTGECLRKSDRGSVDTGIAGLVSGPAPLRGWINRYCL